MRLTIFIASDHAGFQLKSYILENSDYVFSDLGCYSAQSVDYPDYAHILADKVDDNAIGILICGSGIGMSIAANRHKHIRAALCRSVEDATLARSHNNANVLVLGARVTTCEEALLILKAFLSTEFEGGRHDNRINKINR